MKTFKAVILCAFAILSMLSMCACGLIDVCADAMIETCVTACVDCAEVSCVDSCRSESLQSYTFLHPCNDWSEVKVELYNGIIPCGSNPDKEFALSVDDTEEFVREFLLLQGYNDIYRQEDLLIFDSRSILITYPDGWIEQITVCKSYLFSSEAGNDPVGFSNMTFDKQTFDAFWDTWAEKQ